MEKAGNTARQAKRFLLRLLVLSTLLVIAIPLLLILVLHFPAAQTAVIEALAHRIDAATPFSIKLGGYSWRPCAGLQLNDLAVQFEGKEILRCERARLSYVLSVKWPYLCPRELRLEKPTLRLERDREGRWVVPRREKSARGLSGSSFDTSSPKSTSSLLLFPWPRIKIVSGAVMAEQNGQQILSIRDVTGALTLQPVSRPDGVSFRIQIGQWQGQSLLPSWGK